MINHKFDRCTDFLWRKRAWCSDFLFTDIYTAENSATSFRKKYPTAKVKIIRPHVAYFIMITFKNAADEAEFILGESE